MGSEESGSQKHKRNKSFVIREVPIQRAKINNDAEWSRGKSFCEMEKAMMSDYDTPELVVFLQEDRGASAKDKCAMGNCECYEETAETLSCSSASKVSDSTCRNPRTNKCGFRNSTMMVEGDHPTEGSEKEEEVVRLFDKKQEEWCSCGIGTSIRCGSVSASHGSSDSMSSTHSFTFPILQREWSGSPVRMAEPDAASASRRLRWRKILCPCCKC
ncbi:uncharacterized protein LOC114737143 [Neltuma alba]|uniref:uncharacterized protein LOC114721880 n=1 Tax=Neltuma alba TaxID=207710 RepID=UPI0010A41597|nr:uncharacterized protein LOC114721880 [Prosopis alba]XP_028780884.1 uncharacterized protein LOC114737143 [Prosopis alba]XP_028780889.1 uncharacterized protein LOC114737143 [Prosopis alba]